MSTLTAVGQAFPAKVVRVSGTTLFHVASQYLGDPQAWERIASLNGLTDPWIYTEQALIIPQAQSGPFAVPRG